MVSTSDAHWEYIALFLKGGDASAPILISSRERFSRSWYALIFVPIVVSVYRKGEDNMFKQKRSYRAFAPIMVVFLALLVVACGSTSTASTSTYHNHIEWVKDVENHCCSQIARQQLLDHRGKRRQVLRIQGA